jgi:hypothetical protein
VADGIGSGAEVLAVKLPPFSQSGLGLVGGSGAFLTFLELLVKSFRMVVRSQLFRQFVLIAFPSI